MMRNLLTPLIILAICLAIVFGLSHYTSQTMREVLAHIGDAQSGIQTKSYDAADTAIGKALISARKRIPLLYLSEDHISIEALTVALESARTYAADKADADCSAHLATAQIVASRLLAHSAATWHNIL